MFLLNVGSRWTLATEVEEVRGAVFLSASNVNLRFTRKASPELSRVLVDPQLYLAGLESAKCGKTCGRLATHPWFGVPELPAFDSGSSGIREWQKKVDKIAAENWPGGPPEGEDIEPASRSAVECQLTFGCTHIILPAPLIREREEEGTILAAWLDAGLRVAEELEVAQPILATVALSDVTLNDDAFKPAGFLDSLVDHVTARELAGVYIVVAQTGVGAHPFQLPDLVRRAYLHLSKAFRDGGLQMVVVNFADVFGFVCSALGATDVASGHSQNTRRLNLNTFRDDQYGVAVPQYYSHRVIGEFATEKDLGRLVAAKLFRRVADETPYSEDLLEALSDGRTAADLPPWAESQNNLAAAQRHLVSRLATEGTKFRKLTLAKREMLVRDWLEDAEAGVLYLRKRLNAPVIGKTAPAASWLEQLDALLG